MTYVIVGTRKKIEQLEHLKNESESIREKLKRLSLDPRREAGAHMLKGRLKGLWSCWLGSNLRMIYEIDDQNKLVKVVAIGSHKIYR